MVVALLAGYSVDPATLLTARRIAQYVQREATSEKDPQSWYRRKVR
jgi:hypothetical protein